MSPAWGTGSDADWSPAQANKPGGLSASTLGSISVAALLSALRLRKALRLSGTSGTGLTLLLSLAVAAFLKWWATWSLHRQCRFLQLTSPLYKGGAKQVSPVTKFSWWTALSWRPGALEYWTACPACKRPIEVCLTENAAPHLVPTTKPEASGKCAFLICLWGASPDFVLGAMVLGYSIKRTGSKHARVCMYTEDVPAAMIQVLSELWDCRPIEHVPWEKDAMSWPSTEDRFAKVFTKLRGMALTEFEKVLMMDIDLLVRSNVDDLFDLPAPAAMRRGMGAAQDHGKPIDGRQFFLGFDDTKWSWGQGTGINAGVMLWKPDYADYKEMIWEISDPNHPEHMKGNGPEQDYLSRYWADAPWTQISSAYNYQLHQMYFALHPDKNGNERARLLSTPEKIKIVHFSGDASEKPWHRVLHDRWADYWPDRSRDASYAEQFAESFLGHRLWISRDKATFDSEQSKANNWDMMGFVLGAEKQLHRESDKPGEPARFIEVPDVAYRASDFLEVVLGEWFDTLQALEAELGCSLRMRLEAASRTVSVPSQTSSAEQTKTTGSGWGTWANAAGRPKYPPLPARQLYWNRHGGRGGWWTECEHKQDAVSSGSDGSSGFEVVSTQSKLSVVCGSTGSKRFATFVEAGDEVFDEQGADLSGLFVKPAGSHGARHFAIPTTSAPDFDDALEAVHGWIDSVPEGKALLLALLCIPPDAIGAVIEALDPLGVPQLPPPSTYTALAAIGSRPISGSTVPSDNLYASHASIDLAYVSSMVPTSCLV